MRMSLGIFLLLSLAARAHELSGCDSTDLIVANKIAQIARVKMANTYERWLAEDAAIDMSLCARLLSKEDYCVVKERNMERFKDSLVDWYQSGIIQAESTTTVLNRLMQFRSQCPAR